MKKIYLSLLCFFFFTQSWAQEECYELVWADEFDYNGSPDPSKWSFDTGGNGWGNNEDQFYTDRLTNAQVTGGKLKITARKENYQGKSYTSARVISKNTGDWLYGKIEVRAKLPTGQGTWPAIWMLPTDWEYGGWPASGEIDIMEHVGYDQNVVHATVHTEAYNHSIGTQVGKSITDPDVSTAFHDYKLEWTENTIKVSLDDKEYFTFTKHGTYKQWPFDKRFHLLLNIAMGGNWGGVGGPTDDSKLPATMEVEYVRVYQNVTPKVEIEGPDLVNKGGTSSFRAKGAIGDVVWSIPEGGTIIEGEGTNDITVQWGNEIKGSTVEATVQGQCASYSGTFDVNINQGIPTINEVLFGAVDSEGNTLWTVTDTFKDVFTIEADDSLTCVKFDVDDPTKNPRIEYLFGDIYDLSQHNNFSINVKLGNGVGPDMIRVDLLDSKNNSISGDFLELNETEVHDDCNIWSLTYSYDPTKLDLSSVSGLRVYLNYGIFSSVKKGALEIGSITFSKNELDAKQITNDGDCGCISDLVTSIDTSINTSIKVYPNPVNSETDVQIFGVKVEQVELYDINGRYIASYNNIVNNKIVLPTLNKGIYLLKVRSKSETTTVKLVRQ